MKSRDCGAYLMVLFGFVIFAHERIIAKGPEAQNDERCQYEKDDDAKHEVILFARKEFGQAKLEDAKIGGSNGESEPDHSQSSF